MKVTQYAEINEKSILQFLVFWIWSIWNRNSEKKFMLWWLCPPKPPIFVQGGGLALCTPPWRLCPQAPDAFRLKSSEIEFLVL